MHNPVSAKNTTSYFLYPRTGKGVIGVLLAAALIYFQSQPLFRDLDYEYHALTALFLFWLSAGGATIGIQNENRFPGKKHFLFYDQPIQFVLLLIAISFAAFTLGSFLHPCCYWRGFRWFICLPLTAAVAGLATGKIIHALIHKGRFVMLISVAVLSFVYNIVLIFHYPMVSAYSYFWGYFSGPVYDEGVFVDETIIYHRLSVLAIALGTIWIAWKIKHAKSEKQRKKKIYLFILFVFFSAVWLHNSHFEFFRTGEDLQSYLSAHHITDHTSWYADSSIALNDLHRYAMLSEYHYRRLKEEMGLSDTKPLSVYLFRDAKQKKRMTGAGQTQFARIWDEAIYLHQGQVEYSLRHEMVHILAQEFGHPVYGSLSAGLLEGLAVALDWDDEALTLHQWARAVQLRKAMPDMQRMMNEKIFFTGATGLSYTLAGSFCRYLIEQYSMNAFKKVYAGESYEKVYKKSLSMLLDEWQLFLESVQVDSAGLARAAALIRPSYLQRACRHAVSELLDQSTGLNEKGDTGGALEKIQRALYLDSVHSKAHLLYIRILMKAQNWPEAQKAILRALRTDNPHPRFLAILLLKKADLSVISGDTLLAVADYARLAERFYDYEDIHLECIAKKQMLMKKQNIRQYIQERDKLQITGKSDSILNLWSGKLYYDRGDWQSAINRFEQTKFKENRYEYWRYRWMAECHFQMNQWAQAADAFRSAADKANSEASSRLMKSYEEFCQWMVKRNKG